MHALLAFIDPRGQGSWNLPFPRPARLQVLAGGFILYCVVDRLRALFWLLDWVDLAIHEAGHPLFGVLFLGNPFMTSLGGTALQLMMPAAFVLSFLRQGQPKSSDACLIWIGQNFLHIAPYAADARAQVLPLVGGGEHDWTAMLGALGLLRHDLAIGQLFEIAGCLTIAWAVYAIIYRLRTAAPAAAPRASPS